MSSHENQEIAPVTQLQELRSDSETYKTFYQLYGASELQRSGFSVVLNRVLHIDETENRSIHFVVAQADVLQPPIRRQYDNMGTPAHHIPYNVQDIVVASTDGTTIVEYDVLDAHGTYRAELNSTDKQYNPVNEKMELTLAADAIKSLVKARFNVATGNGIVEVGQQHCGWILSEEESARIRDYMLMPEQAMELKKPA